MVMQSIVSVVASLLYTGDKFFNTIMSIFVLSLTIFLICKCLCSIHFQIFLLIDVPITQKQIVAGYNTKVIPLWKFNDFCNIRILITFVDKKWSDNIKLRARLWTIFVPSVTETSSRKNDHGAHLLTWRIVSENKGN